MSWVGQHNDAAGRDIGGGVSIPSQQRQTRQREEVDVNNPDGYDGHFGTHSSDRTDNPVRTDDPELRKRARVDRVGDEPTIDRATPSTVRHLVDWNFEADDPAFRVAAEKAEANFKGEEDEVPEKLRFQFRKLCGMVTLYRRIPGRPGVCDTEGVAFNNVGTGVQVIFPNWRCPVVFKVWCDIMEAMENYQEKFIRSVIYKMPCLKLGPRHLGTCCKEEDSIEVMLMPNTFGTNAPYVYKLTIPDERKIAIVKEKYAEQLSSVMRGDGKHINYLIAMLCTFNKGSELEVGVRVKNSNYEIQINNWRTTITLDFVASLIQINEKFKMTAIRLENSGMFFNSTTNERFMYFTVLKTMSGSHDNVVTNVRSASKRQPTMVRMDIN